MIKLAKLQMELHLFLHLTPRWKEMELIQFTCNSFMQKHDIVLLVEHHYEENYFIVHAFQTAPSETS